MTSQQLREFVALVRTDTPADCTQLQLTVTCDGYDVNLETNDPVELYLAGISMRNLRGEWIVPQKKEAQ
jgi:hypothetical protein